MVDLAGFFDKSQLVNGAICVWHCEKRQHSTKVVTKHAEIATLSRLIG
jgi:hypothetical protein